jgi:hypothetical protein
MGAAFAHNVTVGDKGYLQEISGLNIIPFIYLGAKHMITGYDHILFLFGVIFYLFRLKDVALYVSLFALGHSLTMIAGVLLKINVNPYLIDAIIGFSVIYKALDNMKAFPVWFGFQPDTKIATLFFGLMHGFGLATKLQDFNVAPEGLIGNLLSFNVGVELGQILALSFILIFMGYWRQFKGYNEQARLVNLLILTCGFLLLGLQLAGYYFTQI